MQQKAQRDAERKKKSQALSAQRMTSFRGLDRQQSVLLEMRKAKVADRNQMRQNAASMASFRGISSRDMNVLNLSPPRTTRKKTLDLLTEVPTLELGSFLEEEESAQKRVSGTIGGFTDGSLPQRGLRRQRSSFGDFQEIKEEKKKKEKKSKKVKNSKKKKKEKEKKLGKVKESTPAEPSAARSSTSGSSSSKKKEATTSGGKARKTVELGFSFGMITDLDVIPDMSMIETASIFVVRDILQGSVKECDIRCDPDMPQVENDVEEDVWFDSHDSIRWKIRGSVPVKVYIDKTLDPMEAAAPVQKMLKRYSSYREVAEAGGKVKSWTRVKQGTLAFAF